MIKFFKFLLASLLHPKRLRLTEDQARYVEALFVSGSMPADIGRGMDKTYSRTSFKYFQIPNAKGDGFEFGVADYEIDGLEYIRAAMDKVGAIDKKGYYVNAHPMVQRIATAAAGAPLPKSREEARGASI